MDAEAGIAPAMPEADIAQLQEEVAFWRRDAAARLHMLIAIHAHRKKAHDSRGARDLRVSYIMPTLAAFRDAAAKEWHTRCEACGEFLPDTERHKVIGLGQGDTARIHTACGDPDWHVYAGDRDDEAEIIAEAKRIVEHG